MSFYSLLLPPPNLTGALHLGHLWNIILQDFRYKWEEIRRTSTYWAIGVDHAGLSFQSKFDSLYGAKFSRDRESEYLAEMHKYAESLKSQIHSQFALISSSLPISRSRYTLEEDSRKFVLSVFSMLFSQGLIYRAKKLVNWDIQLKEVLSDCEIEYKSSTSKLYYLKYFAADGRDEEYLTVATSRPETIFGDTALFVHPNDERYIKWIGKKVYIPGVKKEIPILSDVSIDQEFGTGVMKCTPAHDPLDWELGKKYALDSISVIDEDGRLNALTEEFKGLDRFLAREKIIAKLSKLGFLEKVEDYQTNLAFSTKSNTLIEKMVTEQWFLSAAVLARKVARTLREGGFKFKVYPASQKERLLTYLDNMEDWCISRQIPWGIKVPIVYDRKFRKYRVNQKVTNPERESQEDIVLDTWFSSALWPFIVFEGKPWDREKFFPFNTLITGKDILLPWVSRMLFLSYHLIAKLPFKNVYLHGLLKNKAGEKMSKSLGNGILPEALYEKYSSDVIRIAFLMNTNFDRDIRYSELIFQKAATFLHKLEHIFSFFKQKINPDLNRQLLEKPDHFNFQTLRWVERWIYRNFTLLGERIEELYAQYDYFSLVREIMTFYTESLSNRFLELFKLEQNLSTDLIKFLAYTWEVATRIIYPLAPAFATRTYREIFGREIRGVYPKYFYPDQITNDSLRYEWFFEYMREVRRIYQALSLDYSRTVKVTVILTPKSKHTERELEEFGHYFKKLNHLLVRCANIRREAHFPTIKIGALFFELEGAFFDRGKYAEYVEREARKYAFEVERAKQILSRESFKENAPEGLLKQERVKYRDYSSMYKFYSELEAQLR
ncbi:valine--tRNA ligase [Candidatus Mycoplasma haematominutum]|uniref:Valine--tRNA ligase n=1 Tax=Candidatus Mycoplasma haematominutum 'Birmingham 1' TaxID=1116213 RepID=G8C3B2_9MOLU|nr:valine--tRNA ligase [Candidatus Mycoplasma haematominutum]CCE66810.1 valyl-tRNA synthetase [Candidatus Mycoplasma haematominutum 'Birmingham 1']